MPKTERITPAQAGEKIKVGYAEHTILPDCGEKQWAGNWYCITHQTFFENQFAKDVHIDKGTHKLVWHCSGHGFEQP